MQESIHSGHRTRMREKYLRGGADAFETHELLEMLLYHVVSYRDTNPTAKYLFLAFGSIDGILSASPEELMRVPGVGEKIARLLTSVSTLYGLRTATASSKESLRPTETKLRSMVDQYYQGAYREHHVVFHFDNRYRCIGIDNLRAAKDPIGRYTQKLAADMLKRPICASLITRFYPPGFPTPVMIANREQDDRLAEALKEVNVRVIGKTETFDGRTVLRYDQGMMPYLNAGSDERPPDPSEAPLVRKFLYEAYRGLYPDEQARKVADTLSGECRYLSQILEFSPFTFQNVGISRSDAIYLRLAVDLNLRRISDRLHFGRQHGYDEIALYLGARLVSRRDETVMAMLLSDDLRPIACKVIAYGIVNSSDILPRLILDYCAERSARFVILAHNHPSGVAIASGADRIATSTLLECLEKFNVRLLAHFVVAEFEYCDVVAEIKGSTCAAEFSRRKTAFDPERRKNE